jgi:hypothetical protein
MKVLDLLLGRPLASDEAGGEQIGSLVGYQCSGGKTFHIFLEESSLARIPLEPYRKLSPCSDTTLSLGVNSTVSRRIH